MIKEKRSTLLIGSEQAEIANERKLTGGNTAPGSPRLPPARAQYNSTALHRAALHGSVADAELLIAAGAQINHRNSVRAPPPPRARFGSRDPLGERAAPRRESERENLPPPRASRPLSLLTMSRARASRVQEGQTPMWVAAFYGHLDVVRALLNAGADKTIANILGEKPIDVVCTWENANQQHKDAIVALLR